MISRLLKKRPVAIFAVTPAQAGVQFTDDILDSGFRRNDGLLTPGEVFPQPVIRAAART